MITTLLMAAALSEAPLVHSEMSEAERYKVLSPYFDPPLGEEVEVSEDSVQYIIEEDIFLAKGYIEVNPPKGHCFYITRDEGIRDDVVCKKKRLAFTLGQLGLDGRINWHIRAGKKDIGAPYHWKTPHRFAHVIPANDRPPGLSIKVPLRRCVGHPFGNRRRIVVELMDGNTWNIYLPRKDQLVQPQPTPPPNLFVRKEEASGGVSADKTINVKRTHKYRQGKKEDPVTAFWSIPARGAYEMKADNFQMDPMAPNSMGRCRYTFKGAQYDKGSGWMECHHIGINDVVLLRLPCTKAFL